MSFLVDYSRQVFRRMGREDLALTGKRHNFCIPKRWLLVARDPVAFASSTRGRAFDSVCAHCGAVA